jgi:SAM-dependent methyltransferase
MRWIEGRPRAGPRSFRPPALLGVDIDGAALAGAGDRLAPAGVAAPLLRADCRDLPCPAGAFDAVVDFGTLWHIDRADRELAEIARVLAPGGWFIHETRLNQLLSHPVRSLGRGLPWRAAPRLEARSRSLLAAGPRCLAGAVHRAGRHRRLLLRLHAIDAVCAIPTR